MRKNEKAKLIENVNGQRLWVIASVNGENDVVTDSRSKKPIGVDNGKDIAYMQEIDRIEFSTKKNEENNLLSYVSPNNVGVLLSIANKATICAKEIYEEKINPLKHKHKDVLNGSNNTYLVENTQIMYEYLEAIQTSIIFGYTAIESFINLSINDDYKYITGINSKGIIETYDKKAIERWVTLKVKISEILVNIYNCESIKDDIIHQKSIESTSFYEKYFNKEIFELCNTPEEIMKVFFKRNHEQGFDNRIWPLLINNENIMPIFKESNFGEFEHATCLNYSK